MQQFDGSHEEFDYFVIPVAKEKKVQADTVNTICGIQEIGIEKNRIRVVFNKVEIDDSVTDEFAGIFALAKTEKSFISNPNAVIHLNEVYERLKAVGLLRRSGGGHHAGERERRPSLPNVTMFQKRKSAPQTDWN